MPYTMTLPLSGLSCASCVRRAEGAIGAVSGTSEIAVNLATHTARLTLDDGQLPQVIAALDQAGYPARTQHITLQLTGLSCASCVARVEKALTAAPGVVTARINLATETATVTAIDGTDSSVLVKAVVLAGYGATADSDEPANRADPTHDLARATLLAAALTLPVFVLEMGGHLFPAFHHWIAQTIGTTTSWIIQFILTTLVLAGPGARFFRAGIPSLRHGAPDMNALVVLGTSAAWLYSTLALFAPGLFPDGTRAVFFEAACVITTLILLGRWLEARAKGRTGSAIARLAGLQPETAVQIKDGTPFEVPLSDVAAGHILLARPGARIAVDGQVVSGTSWVDESMLTGEPDPAAKSAGSALTGGTINTTGALTYRATAVGADTVLARMIDMVSAAQSAKLPVQALVDRITSVFVPIVMAIAALTAMIWLIFGPGLSWALVASVSVLIIACPCAMGLATPTSITVGMGRAADHGILFRKGSALQTLSRVSTVAFDKTGTLTEGKPTLTTIQPQDHWTRDTLLPLIAAAETASEHPVARALVAAADGLPLPKATDVKAIPGKGLTAQVAGQSVSIGSARFMAELGVTATAQLDPQETPLFAAVDGTLAAILGVSDPIKPDTPRALTHLRHQGLSLVMISGDANKTAQAIGHQLGIDTIHAEVLPGDKAAVVASLPGPVAYVGDGINDAPALATADVGIAVGTGTDIAIESADVVLMAGHLTAVAKAITLSQATMRNIRQNLFWAFAYNAALIPVAAGVLYPVFGMVLSPMLAAGAMALSSVFVVSNALRLKRRPRLEANDSVTPAAR